MKYSTNAFYYGLSEILSKLVPFILLPYLTNTLGTSGFGQLSIYQSWIVLTLVFVSFCQDAAIIRYAYYYGRRALTSLFVVSVLFSSAVFLLLFTISLYLENEVMSLVVLIAYVNALSKFVLTLIQSHQFVRVYLFLQVISFTVNLSATYLLFENLGYITENRLYAIFLAGIALIVVSVYFISRRFTFKKPSILKYKKMFFYNLFFCMPLLFNNFGSFMKTQFDRIFLSYFYTLSEVGFYSVAAQIGSLVLILHIINSKAIEPLIYNGLNNKTLDVKSINIKTLKLGILSFIPFIFAFIMPSVVFTYILGDQFEGVSFLIRQFTFAYAFILLSTGYTFYLVFYGDTFWLMLINILSITVHFFSLYMLVRFSIEYVPLALVITNILHFVLLFGRAQYIHKLKG